MMNATLRGKPNAGNPHVRFDEGEVASVKPRRGSLLYRNLRFVVVAAVCAAGGFVRAESSSDWVVTWDDAACSVGSVTNVHNAYVLNVKRTASYDGFGLQVGWSSGNGVKSVPGLAYLDMRGTITGEDRRADPATNAVWKFSHLSANCFRPNDAVKVSGDNCTATPAQYITGLRTPGTLVSYGGPFHIDTAPNPKNTKEIIVDEPILTGTIGGWGLNAVGALTNLVFRVPKVTKLGGGPLCHMATGWKTDVGKEWDLSGVTTVGDSGENNVLGMSDVPGMIGVLRLPALVNICAVARGSGAAFRGLGIGEAELGLNGNLTRLEPWSFLNCNKMTNVVIGTAVGKTLTIVTNAFYCSGIKKVFFNGDRPTFSGAEGVVAFGTAQAEGTMTFYVRDNASWAPVLAEADANGGLVSAATMRTANRQRVVRYSGLNKVTVELQDPRFADVYHETVTMTTTDGREGDYHYGEVTLTATCSEPDDATTNPRRAKFLRWDGVPVELERQNPLTYVPTKSGTVRAVFAHDWVMTTDAEPDRTMDNGFWRVCCYKRDEANACLGLGRATNTTGHGSLYPATKELRKGGGDLNLNGDVWEPLEDGTWQKWTVTHACSPSPWSYVSGVVCPNPDDIYREGEYDKLPTRITLPETIVNWPGELYNCNSWDNGTYKWPITEFFAICPKVTGGALCAFTFGGVSKLARAVIRVPGLTQIGSDREYGISWSGTGFSKTNFDEWDLSGVKTVTRCAFACANNMNATGTLRLPNVVNVGSNAFIKLTGAQGLVLGTNGLTLKTLGDKACSGMTALTNLTIGTKSLTLGSVLGPSSVFNNKNLKTVHLPGRILPTETVDAILQGVGESATTKQVTIYASPFSHWGRLAAAPTSEEDAVKPADCFGVYRDGLRKAWFVTERSPYEPKGAVMIIR